MFVKSAAVVAAAMAAFALGATGAMAAPITLDISPTTVYQQADDTRA